MPRVRPVVPRSTRCWRGRRRPARASTDLRRRITNAILPEGGTAHVEELSDPYLLWFWNSNVRSTAIVLGTLVRGGQDEEMVKRMVRWLMQVREERALGQHAGERLGDGGARRLLPQVRDRRRPTSPPSSDSAARTLARETFKGRSTEAKTQQFRCRRCCAEGPPGQQLPVVFTRDGVGTLFYMLRLRYAANVAHARGARSRLPHRAHVRPGRCACRRRRSRPAI